jgi:hypothetical protein
MGHNYQARLNPDGVVEELTVNTIEFPDVSVCVSVSDLGGTVLINNLAVKTQGDAAFRTIGDPGLVHFSGVLAASGFVYTAASPDYDKNDGGLENWRDWQPATYYLYRTNIQTGESVRLCEEPLLDSAYNSFAINGDRICFLNADRRLMEVSLSGGTPHLLPDTADTPVTRLAVSKSDIYYINAETEALYRTSDGQELYPGAKCSGVSVDSGGYVWCYFDSENEYYRIILDPGGRVIYQGGHMDEVLIYQDTLIYINIL